jgi:1,4-dihydroxy-2-naphthoate octaprenyltransferase
VTTTAQWVAGARPRTLGLAVAPVAVGTAAGTLTAPLAWERGVAALTVALALQVGANYANDYADGVRGTDDERRGPLRLTATGLARPAAVKRAALLSFGLAAVVGTALALTVDPWLLVLGVGCVAAAWCYTGGARPYGYAGWGEVAVLACFGFAATAGSAYVQAETVPAAAWWGSLVVGLPACAVLLANNVRDIDTDRASGKRTLAVRMGPAPSRRLFVAALTGAFVAVLPIGFEHPSALLALLAAPLAVVPARLVLTREDPPSLVRALVGTVRLTVVVALLLAVGLALA